MHVALVGPCSPQDVVQLLGGADAERAARSPGYRGVPVSELARGLVEAGHQVTVCSTDPSLDHPTEQYAGDGFQLFVHRSRPRPRDYLRDLYAAERRGMASLLRDAAPDVVHAHWTYEFELAAQDSGLPHVTTAHDAPITILRQMRDPYRAARLGVAAVARRKVQHLSTVAPYLAERWRVEMLFRRPIRVIPNSIPQDALPAARHPAQHPVLLEVADASRRKNIPGLLRAFGVLRLQIPEAELRLVGSGLGSDDAIRAWARSQRLDAGVSFLGKRGRSELADEYGRAWLFVHASFEEACPMTLLEAHGAGLPVAGGQRSGGVPFVLDYGRAGTLTDISDAGSFAQTMSALIVNGPPVQDSRAAASIEAQFSPRKVMGRYVEWYQQVI